ncbi:MAG: transcriptional repressor LexA [Clostridia bacterium]|nr:transcriptional repressor LexA [Clostridia bacterium]
MAKLGEKDYRILEFIKRQIESRGIPPTVREICEEIGLSSPATVHARLKKLEEHGMIIKEGAKNRSIKLTSMEETGFREIPLLGKITAGVPITAVENKEGTFPVPASLARGDELFALKVSGESMINVGIFDGDLIVIKQQPTAEQGDIVVALIEGEDATVKTFYKENGRFKLQPENDTMEPIFSDEVEILGKVIGVWHTF